jgi:hypothetical protein
VIVHICTPSAAISRHLKWIIRCADWAGFFQPFYFKDQEFPYVNSVVQYFTDTVLSSFAIYACHPPHLVTPVPWWTDECCSAILTKKWALSHLWANPMIENLIFKCLCAKAHHLYVKPSTHHGRSLSGHSQSMCLDVMWKKLERMSGKCIWNLICYISVDSAVIMSQADIGNTVASSFSLVCNSGNCDPCFRAIKNSAETLPLSFTPHIIRAYNIIFSMNEILTALEKWCNMFSSLRSIHRKMLSHLPLLGREFLLSMYNCIWTELSTSCLERS